MEIEDKMKQATFLPLNTVKLEVASNSIRPRQIQSCISRGVKDKNSKLAMGLSVPEP